MAKSTNIFDETAYIWYGSAIFVNCSLKNGSYTLIFLCDACGKFKKYNDFKREHNPKFSVRRICRFCYYGATKDEYKNFTPRVNKIFNSIKHSAKAKNTKFDINRSLVSSLCDKPCFYCGDSPKSLVRIDRDKGYECGNLVSCCSNCKIAKMGMTKEEFVNHCKKVLKYNGFDIHEKR